jgi:hypothetical protein
MHQYEIRILSEDRMATIATSAIYMDDADATRSARRIARRRRFEIWRGMNCIYGLADAPIINLPAPTFTHRA